MVEVDSEKVEKSGFNPITGSFLSKDSRNDLFKRFTISSSIFENNLTSLERSRRESDLQNISVIQEQEKSLLGVNSNIQALREDILKLGTGLASISLLLQQDGAEEQSRIKAEQERQRRLAEQQIRIGKENEIEQRIQNAVLLPVQTLTPKVNDIFGRIGAALGILFGGWLTEQVVDAMNASEEGNTKLLNDIKFNIVKNISIAIGGLYAIRSGFSLIKRTIGFIASGLTKLLITKPLTLAAGLLPNMGRGGKPPETAGGTKPRGGGGFGGLGKLLTGLSVAMNAKNKEYTDAVLGALSIFAKAPGPIGMIAKVAGVAFTLDEIAEAFGKNIFGDERDKIINDAAMAAKNQLEKLNPTTSTKPSSSTSTSTPTPPPAKPQETMMGQPVPAPIPSPTVTPQQTSIPSPVTNPTSTKVQPSTDMVKKFEMAWQYRNNPMARGRIESAWDKMTTEEKQMAKEWAQSKGYDWGEMNLKDPASSVSVVQQTSPPLAQMSANQQSASAEPTQAQVSVPNIEPQKIGELPEPKPSLTMIKTSNDQNQQVNPPLTSGQLTDVPLINSANPDNFYVLYSYLNYNVVM